MFKYFLVQKALGLALIGLSFLALKIGVVEPLIIAAPMGVILLFSKKACMCPLEETKDEEL